MKKIIATKNAPGALGPYSQGVLVDNMLFVSGCLGLDPVTGELEKTLEDQAHRAFKNLEAIVKEANMTLSDVVKTTVFIDNINDFAAVNGIYSMYFKDNYPARSCVEVSKLPKGGLLEVEAIAKKS